MGTPEVIRFGSLAEAPADHLVGRALFDRMTEASIDWAAGQLDLLRVWAEERRWTSARTPVEGFRFGQFDGLPRGRDAYGTSQLLAQFARAGCEFVLILRDADGDPERADSIRQGVTAFLTKFHAKLEVCIGVPSLELESWILSGFDAQTPREKATLSSLKDELAFDPTRESERLVDRLDHESKSPKRVLALLSEGLRTREQTCWLETPLRVLQERGQFNGLNAFLIEARVCALSVYQGPSPSSS